MPVPPSERGKILPDNINWRDAFTDRTRENGYDTTIKIGNEYAHIHTDRAMIRSSLITEARKQGIPEETVRSFAEVVYFSFAPIEHSYDNDHSLKRIYSAIKISQMI